MSATHSSRKIRVGDGGSGSGRETPAPPNRPLVGWGAKKAEADGMKIVDANDRAAKKGTVPEPEEKKIIAAL
jgi:hypothetical protein